MDNDTNKSCLALLRAILLECRYTMKRDSDTVCLFINTVRDGKDAIMEFSFALGRFYEILSYLGLTLEMDRIERKARA